jgi:tetratricopeptide (TPR) repeat protein
MEAALRAAAEVGRSSEHQQRLHAEQRFLAADREHQETLFQALAIIEAVSRTDPAVAAQIEAFRNVITGLVATASPEQRYWLSRYAAGERAEAFPILAELTDRANRARTETARTLAEKIASGAARQSAHEQRGIAILALNMLFGGELDTTQVIEAWERVLTFESHRRLDHLVLAQLWTYALDDKKAAQEHRIAASLPEDSAMNSSYPVQAFFARDFSQPGEGYRAAAALIRNPPIDVIPSGPLPGIPQADPRMAALLDMLGECEESVATAQAWELASAEDEVIQAIGKVSAQRVPSDYVTPGPKPPLKCAGAVSALVDEVNSRKLDPYFTDNLIAVAVGLAVSLDASGENEPAARLISSAATYCRHRPNKGPSLWLRLYCPFARLVPQAAVENDQSVAPAEADEILLALESIRVSDFPIRQAAWAHFTISQVAGVIFQARGDAPRAKRAFEIAGRTASTLASESPRLPAYKLAVVAVQREAASAAADVEDMETGVRTWSTAGGGLTAFVGQYPNSLGACFQIYSFIEEGGAWFSEKRPAETVKFLREVLPATLHCDSLVGEVSGDPPSSTKGRFLHQRISAALGQTMFRSAEPSPTIVAFEYLAELSEPAFEAGAGENDILYAQLAWEGLGMIAQRKRDFATASRRFQRMIDLNRVHKRRHDLVFALSAVAQAEEALGHAGRAEELLLERHRLCATSVLSPAPSAPVLDRMEVETRHQWCSDPFSLRILSDLVARKVETARTSVSREASGAHRRELSEALFYSATLFELNGQEQEARNAYRESLNKAQHASSAPAVSEELIPFILGGLARVSQSEPESWRARALKWLQAAQKQRALSPSEADLSAWLQTQKGSK